MNRKKSILNWCIQKFEIIREVLGLYFIALFFLVVGCFLLYLHSSLDDPKFKFFWDISVYNEVIYNAGIIFVVLAVGTLTLEFFGFVSYIKKRISEVMIEDGFLKSLNQTKQIKLRTKLMKMIYCPNIHLENDEGPEILQVFDKQIIPLLEDYYFKEYIVYVNSSLIEKDGQTFIKKTISKQMLFCGIDPKLEYIMKDYLNYRYEKSDKFNDEEIVVLNKLIFTHNKEKRIIYRKVKEANNEDSQEVKKHAISIITYEVIDDDDDCNMRAFISEELKFTGEASLEIEYETIVSIDDSLFTNRVNKPCKHYCIHFTYDPIRMKVYSQGFGFMERGKNENKVDVKREGDNMVRFKDWILPGDGTVFAIQKK